MTHMGLDWRILLRGALLGLWLRRCNRRAGDLSGDRYCFCVEGSVVARDVGRMPVIAAMPVERARMTATAAPATRG